MQETSMRVKLHAGACMKLQQSVKSQLIHTVMFYVSFAREGQEKGTTKLTCIDLCPTPVCTHDSISGMSHLRCAPSSDYN